MCLLCIDTKDLFKSYKMKVQPHEGGCSFVFDPDYDHCRNCTGSCRQVLSGYGPCFSIFGIFSDPGTYYNGTHESDPGTNGVYHGGSGKVMKRSGHGG